MAERLLALRRHPHRLCELLTKMLRAMLTTVLLNAADFYPVDPTEPLRDPENPLQLPPSRRLHLARGLHLPRSLLLARPLTLLRSSRGMVIRGPRHFSIFFVSAGPFIPGVRRRLAPSLARFGMSALPPIADIDCRLRNVRFVPIADIASFIRSPHRRTARPRISAKSH